ncbi:Mitogen-activated protein kinase 19, partial [Cucurbita argyrosperma subsp. argyrosperma]
MWEAKKIHFFTEYGDANRYKILEVIGRGSYGVVCSAIDVQTKEKVAIKRIHDIFDHVSDAVRILREVKLLRLLRHPDIVDIKHIMLPPSKKEFKDIYVVFELMESDLHQVIKANDDLTREHHQFFLYQMLRALKFMHTVFLSDAVCRTMLLLDGIELQSCVDRSVQSNNVPPAPPSTTIQGKIRATSCSDLLAMYTPAIDIWSIGCIFAEVLIGKPLFPGKSVAHQLELITDLLGTPSLEIIAGVRNEKARKYLTEMRKKSPVPFSQRFPNADPAAIRLLQRLLAFDPKDRPSAVEALADPYFKGLAKVDREPSCQPISRVEFEFERRKLTKDDIRELLYREILEYHPQIREDYLNRTETTKLLYPSTPIIVSVTGHFRSQFTYLKENGAKSAPVLPLERKHFSLPRISFVFLQAQFANRLLRSTVCTNLDSPDREPVRRNPKVSNNSMGLSDRKFGNPSKAHPPPKVPTGRVSGPVLPYENRNITNVYSRLTAQIRSLDL